MSLSRHKITDQQISSKGVSAAPDILNGTAKDNKAIFDRLIRDVVKELFNALIEDLEGNEGARDVGVTEIEGIAGANVQSVLENLKAQNDAKAGDADTKSALSMKADKAITDLHVKSVEFNAVTGVFTFWKENGSFITFDTALEKVATNWQYDAETQSLVLTLVDGTVQTVPLSAFIAETEFENSDQIEFSVSNHKVRATVRNGSITDQMLSSALVEQLREYVREAAELATDAGAAATSAASSAESARAAAERSDLDTESASESARAAFAAEQNAKSSENVASLMAENASKSSKSAESWAVGGTGTRSGEDTNNSRYWCERAEEAAGIPHPEAADNGKFLRVVEGVAKWETVQTWQGGSY